MKAIRTIAATELRAMFFSPIAWIVLIVFILHSGVEYNGLVASLQDMQLRGRAGFQPLTQILFMGTLGFYSNMWVPLFLYIPLLTMGVISRELSSGSIKLLLSSPVRVSDIVLGKYLALIVYALVLTSVFGCYLLATHFVIDAPDYMGALAGVIGFFCIISAYCAVGLFMSSLTRYQIVAAISTWSVLGLITVMKELGRGVPVLRDVTHWIGMGGRFDMFRQGLIKSDDVVYFVVVIAMFLGFTIIKLAAGRKNEAPWRVYGRYAILTAVCLGAFFLAGRPALKIHWDTTAQKRMTLTEVSQDLLAKVEGPWEITVYANIFDAASGAGFPSGRNSHYDFFNRYTRFNPELTINYVTYYSDSRDQIVFKRNPDKTPEELARDYCAERGLDFDSLLTEKEVARLANVQAEGYRFFRVAEYNERKAPLRIFFDPFFYPMEKELSTAIKLLTTDPVFIGVPQENGEPSISNKGDTDLQQLLTEPTYRESAINNGFVVENVSLTKAVADHVQLLIIPSPETPYNDTQLSNIAGYVASGRSVLLLVDSENKERLQPVADMLGVEFSGGYIAQQHNDYPDTLVRARYAENLSQGFGAPELLGHQPVVTPSVTAIHYRDDSMFALEPVLVSDSELSTHTERGAGSYTIAAALTRDVGISEQRVFVVAGSAMMTNGDLDPGIPNNNTDFRFDLFRWLSHNEFPLDLKKRPFEDREVIIDRDGRSLLRTINYLVVPGLLLFLAFGWLYRRHRR